MKILTISGSQRAASFNTLLVESLPGLAPTHEFTHLDYSTIPVFNQDLEVNFPESVSALKTIIREADAIVIATPEYNRSVPGPLKNFIDWTSRPYGDSAWTKKPVLVMGAAQGPIGTALAQAELRKILLYLNAYVLGQPETYVSGVHEKFQNGVLIDESTKDHLRRAIETLSAYASVLVGA